MQKKNRKKYSDDDLWDIAFAMVDDQIVSDFQIFLTLNRQHDKTADAVSKIFPVAHLLEFMSHGLIFEYRSKAVKYTADNYPVFQTAQYLDWEEFSTVLDHVEDITRFNYQKSSGELFH